METRTILPTRGMPTRSVPGMNFDSLDPVDQNKLAQAKQDTSTSPEEKFAPENIAKDDAISNPTIMQAAETVVADGKTVFKSAVASSMEDAQLKLIPFVERQIELMNNKLLFDGATPTFDQLNVALLQHEGVLLGLTSLYEMRRWAKEDADAQYKEWFAVRCADMRDEVNPRDIAATKWYSSKEIEYIVIRKYREEYAQYTANLKLAEAEVSTMQRLIDSWDSYRWALQTISSNCRAEIKSSEVNGDLNYDESN